MTEARTAELRETIDRMELHALIIIKRENVRYLSGFTGSSSVAVLTPEHSILVTDGRYREQAAIEAPAWDIVIYTRDLMKAVAVNACGARKVGLENTATIGFHKRLAKALDDADITFTDGLVEALRVRKEPDETAKIRSAVTCARHAWDSLLPMIQPGVTERQLAAGLDYRMMMAGADKPAFDTVVASGPNASMPHAGITDRVLEEGDQVVMDFGAMKNGYCCDVTRTVALGQPSERAAEVAHAVRGAWDAAYAAVAPGVACADVDHAARKFLEDAGYGKQFVHGLGHGVGLEVHEKPTVSYLSKETLEPGMVFTIEPGVYLEGETGARHEETVLLTSNGPEVLTSEITSGA
jgi:Xaa-Pro aminopeptidase